MTNTVLLVDDDQSVRDALGQSLVLADRDVIKAASFIEAKDHISPSFSGVIVSDIRMPGKDGFELLAYVRETDQDLPVILLTGEGDIPMAVRGITEGAFNFIEKPCPPQEFLAIVDKAMRARAIVLENRKLKQELITGDVAERRLYGDSDQARHLRDRVRTAARADTEVLITGAPGSGIAKVAHVVHLMSRPDTPFEKRAGVSLLPGLLDEAFSYAAEGTLFIDEVFAMPPDTQLALLEFLEAKPSAKLIAGSYRNLQAEASAGAFNVDLYYRINVIGVHVPALKDRPEDIPVLFRRYVDAACDQAQIAVPEIPSDVISRLMARDWPGNARDLMNAATRFALGMSEDGPDEIPGLTQQMMQVERALLIQALQQHSGNATEAAKALKLPRKTFYDKLARHELRPGRYR